MHIGVPKEIMVDEYRLGMIPAPVREPIHHGYQVTAKTGADPVVGAVLVPSAAAPKLLPSKPRHPRPMGTPPKWWMR